MAIDKSRIEDQLDQVIDVNTGQSLVAGKAVRSIEADGDGWKIRIELL